MNIQQHSKKTKHRFETCNNKTVNLSEIITN